MKYNRDRQVTNDNIMLCSKDMTCVAGNLDLVLVSPSYYQTFTTVSLQ
jgi:hypothetical protein